MTVPPSSLSLFRDAFPGLYKVAGAESPATDSEAVVEAEDDAAQKPEQTDQYQSRILSIATKVPQLELKLLTYTCVYCYSCC